MRRVAKVLNAFRHHRVSRTEEGYRLAAYANQRLRVLNAFRHHGVSRCGRPKGLSISSLRVLLSRLPCWMPPISAKWLFLARGSA